jgi:hypothetical protein
MFAKFGRRAKRYHALPAFVMTFVEAILTLVFVRLLFRLVVKGVRLVSGRPAVAPLKEAEKVREVA